MISDCIPLKHPEEIAANSADEDDDRVRGTGQTFFARLLLSSGDTHTNCACLRTLCHDTQTQVCVLPAPPSFECLLILYVYGTYSQPLEFSLHWKYFWFIAGRLLNFTCLVHYTKCLTLE